MASLRDLLHHIDTQHRNLQKLIPLSADDQLKLDKKFRMEFNYNSNHLEGNTLTYGETELLLLFDQTTGDHEYREYEEMKAHDVALKMVHEEAADSERPLTEQFIRSLNKHLLVREFWKEAITTDGQPTRKRIIPGDYKKTPNSVRLQNGEIFHYTAPEKVAEEIADLVKWYNDNEANEDPVILASLLHYRFVRIHPFDDGNGRVSRLLMNYVLLRKGFPVVVIKSAEKKAYLAALNKADTGDIPAFTAHIAEQVIWSFDLWLKVAKGENIDEPDDLDKELTLLKTELDRKPDNYGKQKSDAQLQQILSVDVIKIAKAVSDKLDSVSNYFVDTEVNIYVRVFDHPQTSGIENSYSIKALEEGVSNLFAQYPKVLTTIIYVNCFAFKKATEKMDVVIKNEFLFEDFHYSILANQELLVKKPYGQSTSDSDTKLIVDYNLRYIIDQIKEVTGSK